MTEPRDDDLLTPSEAAALYGTTTKTLRRILQQHRTPVQHLGGHYRVRRSDLLALRESQFRPLEREEEGTS